MTLNVIFDLDNTLVGTFRNKGRVFEVEARPGAMELLNRLRKLKKARNIKYILFTKSVFEEAEKGIASLGGEDFFDEIITYENIPSFEIGSVEFNVFSENGPFYGLVPVSLLADNLLLVDDNYQMIQAMEKVKTAYQDRGIQKQYSSYLVPYYEAMNPMMLELIYELESKQRHTDIEKHLINETKRYINRGNEISLLEMNSLYDYIEFIAAKKG